MAGNDADQGALFTEQWIEKTNFPFGVDLSQDPPEMRYQLLMGQMHTLQIFPSGERARGVVSPADVGFPVDMGDGWYDGDGKFLGDDPQLPEWATE